ncbi:MAG: ankyrin repeat domain-containing protein [Propionicimonas sp.]
MAKRKTLPKDFDELLKTASLDELKAVFDRCLIDARGGYSKGTAIGFVDCPDGLIVWLVEQGLDVNAGDSYDATPLWERAWFGRAEQIPLLLSLGADLERPRRHGGGPLHAAAGSQKPEATRVLVEHGARIDALDSAGMTPLLAGLRGTENIGIPGMVEVAEILLVAGETVTPAMRQAVERIGHRFEFHRSNFNPAHLAETDAALARLYELFGVTPVPGRTLHDGSAPIVVPKGSWRQRYDALWQLLVPSSGPAATLQGEIIRVTGKLSREILGNGSINWHRDFRAMLTALPSYLGQGVALAPSEIVEAELICRELRSGGGDEGQLDRLAELAVSWVTANPTPLPRPALSYDR